MSFAKTWTGGWRARVLEHIRQRGFTSVTSYAAHRPGVPLLALAEELSSDDIAAAQIRYLLIEEAIRSLTFPRMARDLLTRELLQVLPAGWKLPFDEETRSEIAGALSGWYAELQDHLDRDAAMSAGRAFLNAELPDSWLPDGPDDPVIVSFVDRCLGRTPS